ncbi:MAG: hypothetical protein JSV31_06500 [Desulfobacterales bacterium]|nr:MAG: hypothetical protein JSV31_06500 [Desulfobacterales bacterium]
MTTQIVIQPSEGIQKEFVGKVQSWINEVLEKKGTLTAPAVIFINIWRGMDELQAFYQQEQQELGIATGGETDFLATHEAWKDHPRIHICQERVKDVQDVVLQGVLHHEMSHAFHHGTPEFYTFRYSTKLQQAGQSCGMDLELLQQFVYMLSVALKDYDVVTWLTDIGLGFGQLHLLEYMISDTEDERRIWEVVCTNPTSRKLAVAHFLKTLLPIEALVSLRLQRAEIVKNQWKEAYRWLSETIQEELVSFAHIAMTYKDKPFQQRLENVTFKLIAEASL